MSLAIRLAEKGLLPDPLVRTGIRGLLRQHLRQESGPIPDADRLRLERLVSELRRSPIALEVDAANDQHYELPAAFFQRILGRHLKYSGCYWPDGISTLDDAEQAMLELTTERAGIEDGMEILELGCGWGSLSLWIAERYPRCRIQAVSNSRDQRLSIESVCRQRGLTNLDVVTADMNDFSTERRFDRVVSVEMFEHMRNYEKLLARIHSWLRPDGKLFVHIFCHHHLAYPFEVDGQADWMARYFFTGGLMPSEELLLRFQRDLQLEQRWRVNGRHYEKTARAWLANLDAARTDIRELFARVYGPDQSRRWLERWRLFFLACAELFGYNDGEEWLVAHYLFRRAEDAPRPSAST